MPINFGSDGFRGIISHDFTYENVARIAGAVAQWWPEDEAQRVVPIGYDRRFLSLPMAKLCAGVLRRAGFMPQLTVSPCPSPYLALCVHHLSRPIGVQVTASHNPYYYNGIKLKGRFGGSLREGDVKVIQQFANDHFDGNLNWVEDDPRFDLRNEYYAAITEAAGDVKPARVIIDYMHGAGADVYSELLQSKCEVVMELRNGIDPLFGGAKPEPLQALLPNMIQKVSEANDGTVGLAFDGDGDRLAVIDEIGAYLQSHEIFALLLDYLASKTVDGMRVYGGRKVVTTVSFSSLLAKIAESYGLEVIEVPVGFKHVTEAMLAGDVLIGGEESGGAAFGHYLPERDALLMALLLLKAKGEAGVTLHEMLRDIYSRFGRSEFVHVDVQMDPAEASELRARIPALMEVQSVAGEPVASRSDKDGVKLCTAEGWVLVRSSGTEPLARFYAEAASKDVAQRLIADVRAKIL